MQVTIGGNRVGSGRKMKAHLNNYYRSTHNLSEKWASSMGSGILYPAMVKLGLRGDTFTIKANADCRTIPTKGPLFGSFKMQIDFFQCPIRLYQGILHNNPLAIGLKMNQVLFPELKVVTGIPAGSTDYKLGEFSKSCLLKYLGMSGMGSISHKNDDYNRPMERVINALPALSYYDIFKTYYANKQEENAYVLTANVNKDYTEINKLKINGYTKSINEFYEVKERVTIQIQGNYLNKENIEISFEDEEQTSNTYTLNEAIIFGLAKMLNENEHEYIFEVDIAATNEYAGESFNFIKIDVAENTETKQNLLKIQEFDLTNIDKMRYALLSSNELGNIYQIDANNAEYPYKTLVDYDLDYKTMNAYPMNGLVLKTYQNDIFNNWLNSEWIEGENGINELSKVSVENGAFSMDALNFAQKIYNMLNRVAVAGATYEDWQDVVYEQIQRRQIESPIFVGGMSQEVMFDEIVQTAPAEGDPLGTLGGRGRLVEGTRKGGTIHIKCDEACFIIAIVSLTPRQFYTQGNEFYMTELITMDDMHKPAMDGIGFQDLIGERLAWWDTRIGVTDKTPGGSPTWISEVVQRSKVGKLPAWIEYMTSYDRAFGDLAENYGAGYMILNRNYERDTETGGIKDATTYIDPSKYNYAFAYTPLDAQNFWVEIGFNIEARRLMSARLIPHV